MKHIFLLKIVLSSKKNISWSLKDNLKKKVENFLLKCVDFCVELRNFECHGLIQVAYQNRAVWLAQFTDFGSSEIFDEV